MQFAFMTFSTPKLSLKENLEVAKRFGYAGIEPRLDSSHAHGVEVSATPAQRDAIRKTFEDSGIACCCLATSCRFADPATAGDMLAQCAERIDLAGDVGSPRLRVFGGPIPEGVSRADAIRQVAESLKQLADQAGQRNVTLCLETHDDWCDPRHLAEVLEQVNHPRVGANWDIMHPIRKGGADMDSASQALKPWIRHCHIHDGTKADPLKMKPIGQGDIDHKRALELLTDMGYDGFLSGEWINWSPWQEHLPRELATLKDYQQQLTG